MSNSSESRQLGGIKCIFFSEFHAEYGPRIVCQIPENFISKEMFDSISVYVIPKPGIQKRTVTNKMILDDSATEDGLPPQQQHPASGSAHLSSPPSQPPDNHTSATHSLKFIGYPNSIADAKYARNAFIFNVCVVCDGESRTLPYEPLVRKLSEWLVRLEIGGSLLTSEAGRRQMPALLRQTMTQLNDNGAAVLSLGDNMPVYLKVVHPASAPSSVEDHDVPVWLGERPTRLDLWDMTSQQVVPHISGMRHVVRISQLACVDLQLVKACVQNLLYTGLVQLVSIFQYSNLYAVTDQIASLYSDQSLQTECSSTVARSGCSNVCMGTIFRMYCSLSHGRTVLELCSEFDMAALGVDERKLILFGLVKGIIRRIHKYPVCIDDSRVAPSIFSANNNNNNNRDNIRLSDCVQLPRSLLDGSRCMDALCVRTGMAARKLTDRLEREHNTLLLWK